MINLRKYFNYWCNYKNMFVIYEIYDENELLIIFKIFYIIFVNINCY